MDPYSPNAFGSDPLGPDGDQNRQPPPPEPVPQQDAVTYSDSSVSGAELFGGALNGADGIMSVSQGIGELATGAAETVGEAASGAAEAVGGLAEGVGSLAEGCGGCSLAVLVMLFAAVGTAFAFVR